jgi:energy-coupling factor transporter ATP-binding protein EcfA2
MENNLKKLVAEVNHLHTENVVNAQRTAENAIIIGVKLHQIKETVPHGDFERSVGEQIKIAKTCCFRYMRLACERVIEEKAKTLLLEEGSSGNGKSSTMEHLEGVTIPEKLRSQARAEVESMEWSKLDIKPKELVRGVQGKELTELYREYGIIRPKEKPAYHPPKKLSPEEQLAAENEQAEAQLIAVENAVRLAFDDLNSKTGTLSVRIKSTRWKEHLALLRQYSKAVAPLTKRKGSK